MSSIYRVKSLSFPSSPHMTLPFIEIGRGCLSVTCTSLTLDCELICLSKISVHYKIPRLSVYRGLCKMYGSEEEDKTSCNFTTAKVAHLVSSLPQARSQGEPLSAQNAITSTSHEEQFAKLSRNNSNQNCISGSQVWPWTSIHSQRDEYEINDTEDDAQKSR